MFATSERGFDNSPRLEKTRSELPTDWEGSTLAVVRYLFPPEDQKSFFSRLGIFWFAAPLAYSLEAAGTGLNSWGRVGFKCGGGGSRANKKKVRHHWSKSRAAPHGRP